MNIHKLRAPDNETAVDPLDDGGADLEELLTSYDEAVCGFRNLHISMLGLHDKLIARARLLRRAETRTRKLAARVIETVNE